MTRCAAAAACKGGMGAPRLPTPRRRNAVFSDVTQSFIERQVDGISQRRLKVGPKLTSLLDLGFSRVPHPGSNPHGAGGQRHLADRGHDFGLASASWGSLGRPADRELVTGRGVRDPRADRFHAIRALYPHGAPPLQPQVGIDSGWASCLGVNGSWHDAEGQPVVNLTSFPSMKKMVDYGVAIRPPPSRARTPQPRCP